MLWNFPAPERAKFIGTTPLDAAQLLVPMPPKASGGKIERKSQ
jgi:hypothetical protein